MLEEAGTKLERIVHTLAQKADEALAVKLEDLLQVREDDALFAAQRLRQRCTTVHQRDVVVDDVLQRTNVADFRVNELLHYQRLCPAKHHESKLEINCP